ncbi:hypothetical protein BGZ82_001420 [Podila clonocystis]|nr:hypothetical protein BGZ82_001420 [Podila clonocystis]
MAEKLLASLLVYYKDATTPLLPHPPVLRDLQTFIASAKDISLHYSSEGTELEKQSFDLATDSSVLASSVTLVDRIFNVVVNLHRPSMTHVRSAEINAKAVFNVMIASMIDGVSKMDDCERLLVLCIHLKDTSDRYPLRVLAINNCFEMLEQQLLPVSVRKSILRFVLGPADFVMHHLEWRISLLERVNQLIKDNSYDDIEFRALLRRIANKLGVENPTAQIEKDKVKLYSYLELVVLDPVIYTSLDTVSKKMSAAQWTDIMRQDLIIHLYLTEFRPQLLLFIETLRVFGVTYSPYTPGLVHMEALGKHLGSHIVIQLSACSDSLLDCFQRLEERREQPSGQDKHILRTAFDKALDLALDNGTLIQELLLSSVHRTRNALESVGASALLEIAQILARFVIVAPSRYLPQIMWMVAVVQRVASDIKQDVTLEQKETSKIRATFQRKL